MMRIFLIVQIAWRVFTEIAPIPEDLQGSELPTAPQTYLTWDQFKQMYFQNPTFALYKGNSQPGSAFNQPFRRAIYEQNVAFIKQHNSNPNRTYNMDINQFALLTSEEFIQIYCHFRPSQNHRVQPTEVAQEQPFIQPRTFFTPSHNGGQNQSKTFLRPVDPQSSKEQEQLELITSFIPIQPSPFEESEVQNSIISPEKKESQTETQFTRQSTQPFVVNPQKLEQSEKREYVQQQPFFIQSPQYGFENQHSSEKQNETVIQPPNSGSNSTGNSTGNSDSNSTGNSGGNSTGNSGSNSTGNSGGNSTGNSGSNSTGNSGSNSTGNSGSNSTGNSTGNSGSNSTGNSGSNSTGNSGSNSTGNSSNNEEQPNPFSPPARKLFSESQESLMESSIDFTKYAGPIRHQGLCGSCYAFASVDTVFAIRLKNGCPRIMLSPLQLVSYSEKYGNKGCEGGSFENSFKYMQQYGISLEESVPYGNQLYSRKKISPPPLLSFESGSRIAADSFINIHEIPAGDCKEVVRQLATNGPIPLGVSSQQMQFYKNGLFTGDQSDADHGVILFAFYPAHGFLIKNFWGIGWGIDGMMWLHQRRNAGLCNSAFVFELSPSC